LWWYACCLIIVARWMQTCRFFFSMTHLSSTHFINVWGAGEKQLHHSILCFFSLHILKIFSNLTQDILTFFQHVRKNDYFFYFSKHFWVYSHYFLLKNCISLFVFQWVLLLPVTVVCVCVDFFFNYKDFLVNLTIKSFHHDMTSVWKITLI